MGVSAEGGIGPGVYAGLTVRIQCLPVRPVHGPPRCPFVQDWLKQEPRERGWTQDIAMDPSFHPA